MTIKISPEAREAATAWLDGMKSGGLDDALSQAMQLLINQTLERAAGIVEIIGNQPPLIGDTGQAKARKISMHLAATAIRQLMDGE